MTEKKSKENEAGENINSVEYFLNNCKAIKKQSTRDSYKSHLKAYFEAIGKDQSNYIVKDFRKLENGDRVDILKTYEKDINNFAEAIKNRPPKSRTSMIAGVKKFLSYFYIDLPQRIWDDLRIKDVSIIQKKTPKPEELKFILANGNTKQKALLLLSSSSGLRISELLQVTFDTIDLDNRTIRVKDNTTKKGYSRTSFFTEEAKSHLEDWLKIREHYIKIKKHRTSKEKVDGYVEKRIFPFGYLFAREQWVSLIEKAGAPFNERDVDGRLQYKQGRYIYNEHSLRRYFKTNLRTTGISERYIDFMIGHKNEMNETYTDEETFVEKAREEYDKYSHVLNVFSDADRIKTKYDGKISMQDRHIQKITTENEVLKSELKDMKFKIEVLTKTINDLGVPGKIKLDWDDIKP